MIGMESALANSKEEKEILQEKISRLSVQLVEKEEGNIKLTKNIEGDNICQCIVMITIIIRSTISTSQIKTTIRYTLKDMKCFIVP